MRKDGVVTGLADRFHQSLRRRFGRIEFDQGAIGHQVDMRGLHAGSLFEGILNMMLT